MQAREGSEPSSDEDERWMREALRAAREAARGGEVPVGACAVGSQSARATTV
jgi:tRNA(Arg) A34 adenosine deaminase TadA